MDVILQTTLANIFQQLADFFGMTTEAIMQNAPYWLAKYGWYSMISDIPDYVFGGIFLTIAVILIIMLIWVGMTLEQFPVKIAIIISVIILIFSIAMPIIQCAIAPEIYGLNALINLLK